MGSLLLCNHNIVKNPYLFRNTMTNIYSMEELCFYIYNNVYLIDEGIMNKELVRWIGDEIGYEELADELSKIIKGRGTLALYVERILSSVAYYGNDEILEVRGILTELSNKSEFYRKKIKADNLLDNKKYAKAILEYNKVLDCERDETVTEEQVGAVYHNRGVCFARAMLFLQAVDNFEKAYDLNKSEESLEELNLAKKLLDNNIFTDKENEDSQVLKDISELTALKENGQVSRYYEEIGKIITKWKEEYRVSME